MHWLQPEFQSCRDLVAAVEIAAAKLNENEGLWSVEKGQATGTQLVKTTEDRIEGVKADEGRSDPTSRQG